MMNENWVVLKPGVVKRLHFSMAKENVAREITDPVFQETTTVMSTLLKADYEDGSPVNKTFSILSDKLRQEFASYVEGGRFRGYEFILIKDAPGTVPPRIVEVRPWVKPL